MKSIVTNIARRPASLQTIFRVCQKRTLVLPSASGSRNTGLKPRSGGRSQGVNLRHPHSLVGHVRVTHSAAIVEALGHVTSESDQLSDKEVEQRADDWRSAYLWTRHGKPVKL